MIEMDNTVRNTEAYQALLQVDQNERTFKSRQGYTIAYAMSLFIPPLGVFYFFKYVFFANGTSEDIKAGCISLVLTIVSLLVLIWIIGILFKQTTTSLPKQSGDTIMELITPENQNKLKDLYR